MIEDSEQMLKLKLYIKQQRNKNKMTEDEVIQSMLETFNESTEDKIAKWVLLGGEHIKKDNMFEVKVSTLNISAVPPRFRLHEEVMNPFKFNHQSNHDYKFTVEMIVEEKDVSKLGTILKSENIIIMNRG